MLHIDQAIAASGHADAITVTCRSFELFPDAGEAAADQEPQPCHASRVPMLAV